MSLERDPRTDPRPGDVWEDLGVRIEIVSISEREIRTREIRGNAYPPSCWPKWVIGEHSARLISRGDERSKDA